MSPGTAGYNVMCEHEDYTPEQLAALREQFKKYDRLQRRSVREPIMDGAEAAKELGFTEEMFFLDATEIWHCVMDREEEEEELEPEDDEDDQEEMDP